MSESISQYINRKELPDFGYKIYIRNETSHTQFSKPELFFLKELKEQGVLLEVPQNICQKGHSLTLFFVDKKVELRNRVPDSGALKEASFHVLVKVTNVESTDRELNSVIVDLQFTQFDTERWKKMLQAYFDHQKEVSQNVLRQHRVRDEE